MTANRFGGRWTVDKLDVLQRYLDFYTRALATQPAADRPFKLVYIDAFAGTGRCRIKQPGGSAEIPGSATLALGNPRPFEAYHFIERKPKHFRELQALVADHPLADRTTLHQGSADDALDRILCAYNWRSHRGVLFLDPFGLQCSWPMLERIQATEALDVFFLLSVSGLFRNASIDAAAIDPGKHDAITRVLGTEEWRSTWYKREQLDIFGGSSVTRDPGWAEIVDFATQRLRLLFPEVVEPRLLRSGDGPPLFALYLAVSNPAPAARKLAGKVGREILSQLR